MSIQSVSPNLSQAATAGHAAQTAAQTVASPASTGKTSSTASSPASSSSYTVSISNAGRAALLESRETSVQTAQEASHGDRTAQRLLAKEQAAKAQ